MDEKKYFDMRNFLFLFTIIALVLAITYFGIRIPFFKKNQGYEEGIFSYIFINHPQKPNYGLNARIDGIDILGSLSHPSLMYEFISKEGKLTNLFANLEGAGEKTRTEIIRFVFSLPLFVIALLAMSLIAIKKNRQELLLSFMALLALISSPMALVASTELQIDGSFGVLAGGLLGLAILYAIHKNGEFDYFTYFLIFTSSFLLSLGKNEWSIVLLASYLIAVAYCFLFYKNTIDGLKKKIIKFLLIGFLGMIIGNLFSYFFDPQNYTDGLHLLLRMAQSKTAFGANETTSWLVLTRIRLPFFAPYLVFLSLIACAFLKYRKNIALLPLHIFIFSFSVLLFGCYFISSWGSNYPRYFVISLATLVIAFLGFLRQSLDKRDKKIMLILLTILLLSNYLIFDYALKTKDISLESNFEPAIRSTDCLPILSSGKAYFDRNLDFVGSSMGEDYARSVSIKYNKPLCK